MTERAAGEVDCFDRRRRGVPKNRAMGAKLVDFSQCDLYH
jgi:hypothetical protein